MFHRRKFYPKAGMILLFYFLFGCAHQASVTKTEIVQQDRKDLMTEQIQKTPKTKNRTAVVETTKGTFQFELFEDKAPVTTANFIKLAASGFYTGLKFHRYEPGFVIQGGDPKGDGTGGSKETIVLEIHPGLRHVKGAVGMARSQNPNSASSQFYVTLAPAHFLDDNYAVFGLVTEGMEVVLTLRPGDSMKEIKIK